MYCPYCGNSIPDNAVFCPNCGMKIAAESQDATMTISNHGLDENQNNYQYPPQPDDAGNTEYEEPMPYVPPAPMPGRNPYSYSPTPQKQKKKSPLLVVIIIEVIAIIAVIIGIFLMLKGGNDHDEEKGSTSSVTTSASGDAKSDGAEDGKADAEETLTATATPTALPTATVTPVPTPKPVTETSCHVTDAQPSDLGNYKRPSFTSANASSSLFQKDHPDYDNTARSIIDNDYVSSWQDGVGGNGTGESFTISFDSEKKVKYLEFRLGNWRTDHYYNINSRPRQMTMTINGKKYSLEFTDAKICHYVDFDKTLTLKSIDFYIDSVYSGSETGDCCITEITAYGE